MKASELMIGDWVEVVSNDHLKYIQIAEIYQSSILTKESEFESEEVSIDNINPIPLTPEILEKNRFKKCAGNEWSLFKYEDDDYTKKSLYQVLWSADELYLEITSYTFNTGDFNRIDIRYVHELQNALRLCGIEKTIEL